MMTSSNGNISALLALCAGNSPVTIEFPAQRPVTWSFDVFFHLCLNKRLSKQSRGWWFEMPWCSLWHHCNDVCWCHQQPCYWPSSREITRPLHVKYFQLLLLKTKMYLNLFWNLVAFPTKLTMAKITTNMVLMTYFCYFFFVYFHLFSASHTILTTCSFITTSNTL